MEGNNIPLSLHVQRLELTTRQEEACRTYEEKCQRPHNPAEHMVEHGATDRKAGLYILPGVDKNNQMKYRL